MSKIYNQAFTIPDDEARVGNLRLDVVSMWDFGTEPICYKKGLRDNHIGYVLRKCTYLSEDKKGSRWEDVKNPNASTLKQLKDMGYTISTEVGELSKNE